MMMKKTALFGIFISGLVFISTVDTAAQRIANSSGVTRGGRAASLAVDPSDPSGNTVYTGRRRTVSRQTSTSVVAGNKIGTDRSLLNNKNPELTRVRNAAPHSGLTQPTMLQAPGNDINVEEMTIVHEGIESAVIRRRGVRP